MIEHDGSSEASWSSRMFKVPFSLQLYETAIAWMMAKIDKNSTGYAICHYSV